MSKENIDTEAIVLHYIDYADSSIIVRLFTKSHGLLSCIAKGVKKKSKKGTNKMSMFLPLNFCEVNIYYNSDKELHLLSEIHSTRYHQHLHTDIKKMAYTSFIAEFLLHVLHQDAQSEALFDFLKEKIIQLDGQQDKLLHLYFHIILNVCGYLGYQPNASTWEFLLDAEDSAVARFLNEIYFNPELDYVLSEREKKTALAVTERFMQMYIHGFKPLQSTVIWSLIY